MLQCACLPRLANDLMNIAYLVSQYPKVSHSFIRREILAVEAQSHSVLRISVRPPALPLVDPDDVSEAEKTYAILSGGPVAVMVRLLLATTRMVIAQPMRFWTGLRSAWRLGRRSDRGLLRNFAYLAEACVVLKLTRKHRIEHVHAHFGTNSAAVAMLCRQIGGPTYSFTVHGPDEFDKPTILGFASKARHASFIAAITSYCRSQLYRWIDAKDWAKVRVVRCGLDKKFLQSPIQPATDARRLICVGRLSAQKGQLLLLEAAAIVRRQIGDFELVFAGDGEMRPQIEQRIASLELGPLVRITGWISSTQVRDELLASRALVLPSFAEGLPVVIMESLALGRPVITTFIAGIPELVENHKNGWLVPAGDVELLAKSMQAALECDTSTLDAMGANGRTQVCAFHDVNREATRLLEHISSKPST